MAFFSLIILSAVDIINEIIEDNIEDNIEYADDNREEISPPEEDNEGSSLGIQCPPGY